MTVSAGAIRAGAAFVELYAEDDKFARSMKSNEQRLTDFGKKVGQVGREMLAMGAIMVAALAIPTKIYAAFSDQMQVVRAVTAATTEQFAALDAQAKQLGRTTSYTAQQVAEGMTSLGRAGFDPGQIEAAIGPILNLARATGTELAQAAEIAAATLRGFRMEASETIRVADVLTTVANSSAQTLADVGEAMKYVAPIAAEANESIESVSVALGVMANMGIKGTMAGTALRNMFLQLADTGVQEQLHAIGVEALDSAGNLRPIGDIMAELGQIMANLGSGTRLSLAEALFGRRAIGAALKLAGTPEEVAKLQFAILQAGGAAAKTAEEMDSELGGPFDECSARLWTLQS